MKILKIKEQHYLKCVFGRLPWQQCKYFLLSETEVEHGFTALQSFTWEGMRDFTWEEESNSVCLRKQGRGLTESDWLVRMTRIWC